ncbi:D-alanyl-D-alanine carboxypeptidase family protein [Paenibacillus pinihumi]|uniref:D-alanyl-D-alanine carboxypeptidase family protein n=1 Tax=Paenibacillus pinihumi TaxID=669462 RepID=UPI0003FDAEF3|nr:D-alanyl-D-alanine carboxypeptidase family protein [Paenibacillus pinihumi]
MSGILGIRYAEAKAPGAPGTHAKAASLIDVESGRILFSHNGDEQMLIASLTKIMTAIVAIEHGNLSDIVKVSKSAFGKEGSSIYLKLGEEMSLQNMLYGLMLRSGNDAATAIAEHVGGSEEGFVVLMNEKAQWLGLEHTHFTNPHGLDHKEHYSTANDLAKLAAYALRNKDFREIVKTKMKQVSERDYSWRNKNKMLFMYEGADGVKTGYTKQAFRTLVSSATRNGQQLAAVTLNDGNDWVDHSTMLDWGFGHYPLHQLVREGQPLAGYPYEADRGFQFPLTEEERSSIKTKLILQSEATTEYALGARGGLELYLGEEKIGTVAVRDSGPEIDVSGSAKTSMASTGGAISWLHSLQLVLRSLFR